MRTTAKLLVRFTPRTICLHNLLLMKLAIFYSCQFVWVCFSMQVPCLYHWVYLFTYYFLGMLWTPSSISSGLLSVSIVHKLLASSLRRNFWYDCIHLSQFPCKIKVMINGVLLLCVVIVYFQIRHDLDLDLVWLQEFRLTDVLICYLSMTGAMSKSRLNSVWMQLRKNCNHPDLFSSHFEDSCMYYFFLPPFLAMFPNQV